MNSHPHSLTNFPRLSWHQQTSMLASSSAHPSELPRRPENNIFALVIGIDRYLSTAIPRLSGAVADATDIKDYLENHLRVPDENINFLVNEDATRSNILKNFERLAEDDRIKMNDPILIFYAGHGALATGPRNANEGNMELLVSHDFMEEDGSVVDRASFPPQQEGVRATFMADSISRFRSKRITGILDLELAVRINRIALFKGDNITVVLDCCHSASLTRSNGSNDTVIARTIGHPADYKLHRAARDSLDSEEVKNLPYIITRGARIPAGSTRVGFKSHMMLAACKSTEFALESQGRGHFSTEFLKFLTKNGNNLNNLTYKDLLNSLVSTSKLHGRQHPQFIGDNINRRLFDGKVTRPTKKSFRLDPEKNKDGILTGKFTVAGGINEGILSTKAKFAIYSADIDNAVELTTLVVEDLQQSTCTLAFSPGAPIISLPKSAIAVQIGAPVLVHIHHPAERIQSKMRSLLKSDITVVESETDADVSMRACGNQKIEFRVVRRMATPADDYKFTPPYREIKEEAEEISRILKHMSFFFWQLDLRADIKNTRILDEVDVGFYELELDDEDGIYTAIGDSLCVDNKIDFMPKLEVPYGICLINKSTNRDFYPCIYYFDLSDFSILKYYGSEPPVNDRHDVECPLPRGKALEIGYGSGGAPPLEYFIPPEQDNDIGVLKIFLFRNAVDLGDTLKSPFDPEEPRAAKISTRIATPRRPLSWGVIDIPMIQRRRPPKLDHRLN